MNKLYLIPTPIAEGLPLEPVALELLKKASTESRENSVFVCEDAKPGRRLWLSQGLPRECVEEFKYLNEHTKVESTNELLSLLKKGKNVYLMSDGGLPAYCDPGTDLVDLCHKNGVTVTMSPFPHSIAAALALSGYNIPRYHFFGFLPKDQSERDLTWKEIAREKFPKVIMDTPYRLKKVLEEAKSHQVKEVFLALDLNGTTEFVKRGSPQSFLDNKKIDKAEFILIIP